MNKFILGMATSLLYTTPEGRKLSEKIVRVATKSADKMLKEKFNLNVSEILNEEEENGENDEDGNV